MSRVLTFSRTFPSYHPKKGQPTYFVEKLNKSLPIWKYGIIFTDLIHNDIPFFDIEYYKTCEKKYHTIRAGHRWKVGDKFSPRVWSGKPYQSKQIIIAPDLEVKKVWDFEIKNEFQGDGFYNFFYLNGTFKHWGEIEEISKNDGLELADFVHLFKANDGYFSGKEYTCSFDGQIICWDENINY
jgi:hypothetical protein